MCAIALVDRGAEREVAPPAHGEPPDCIGCLACAHICPTQHITFSEDASTRTIWGKSFELLKCTECGKAHVTRDEAAYFSKKQGVSLEYFAVCDRCKRDHYAKKFAELSC